jgi:hypothetical protein
LGRVVVVIAMGFEFIVTASVIDCVNVGVLESLTTKVTGLLSAVAVGVPEITPVSGTNANPGGSVPLLTDQE